MFYRCSFVYTVHGSVRGNPPLRKVNYWMLYAELFDFTMPDQ